MLDYANRAGDVLENEQAAISLGACYILIIIYAKLHCRFLHTVRETLSHSFLNDTSPCGVPLPAEIAVSRE